MGIGTIQKRLGMLALALSLFLIIYGIPSWVSAPANVPKIVLSPVFWPMVLAAVLGIVGLGLLFSGTQATMADAVDNGSAQASLLGYIRLFVLAVVMVATVLVLPVLGLVWTSMLTIVALAVLVECKYYGTVLMCAVFVPLLLYGFFAHLAGVAIPQGEFLRLP